MIWIPVTLAAAALQVVRNALQRGLLPTSGPWAATLVRFLFGLPFAAAMTALAWLFTPGAEARLTPVFWANALSGALTQVLATAALLVAMRRAGFGVGTAMQQSSLPLAALLGLVVFGDRLSTYGWTGVAIATAGLLALSWPRHASGPRPVSGAVYGLLSGLCFAWSLNAYRHATLALDGANPIFGAVTTVMICQAVQSAALVVILAMWDRPALLSVFQAWRRSLGAGAAGAAASIGWLLALALAPAAAVRAVGVVESPIAAAAGRRLFAERLNPFQLAAGAAVAVGVALTAFA